MVKLSWTVFFIVLSTAMVFVFIFLGSRRVNKVRQSGKQSKKAQEKITSKIVSKSIFVPYWSLNTPEGSPSGHPSGDLAGYDRLIYFGVTANYQGVDQTEIGYSNLSAFVKASHKEKLLTLRLLNDDFNKDLLKDKDLQEKIIKETLIIVNEKNFAGVVLDLELFSLLNTDIKDQINEFVERFYTAAKSNYKSFTIVLYGDTFYRGRPYDLPFINKNSDEIMVMAYDFSKSIGEPGPNFPFARGSLGEGGLEAQSYNYSFKKMVSDFVQIVPKEKLTIIFGLFGYDWRVDEKKRPIAPAKALTLAQIKKQFFDPVKRDWRKCDWKNCVVKRDEISKETEINFTTSSNTPDEQRIYRIDYHVIWFEDEESVKVKTQYLQEQGIGSIGYWAWEYF